jgi:hypothetical protein
MKTEFLRAALEIVFAFISFFFPTVEPDLVYTPPLPKNELQDSAPKKWAVYVKDLKEADGVAQLALMY